MHQELWHVREPVYECPLFLPLEVKSAAPAASCARPHRNLPSGPTAKPEGASSFLSITTRALSLPLGGANVRSSARMLPLPEAPI